MINSQHTGLLLINCPMQASFSQLCMHSTPSHNIVSYQIVTITTHYNNDYTEQPTIYVTRDKRISYTSWQRHGKAIVTLFSCTLTAKRVDQSNGRGPRTFHSKCTCFDGQSKSQYHFVLLSYKYHLKLEHCSYVSLTNFEGGFPIFKNAPLSLSITSLLS